MSFWSSSNGQGLIVSTYAESHIPDRFSFFYSEFRIGSWKKSERISIFDKISKALRFIICIGLVLLPKTCQI